MKHSIGVSAVLVAALHSPSAALERVAPDELMQSSPTEVRVAQTGSVELPATRASGVSGIPISLSLKSPISGVRFIKIGDFPEQLQLSRGFRLQGSWITSVHDLENLELITPPGLVKTIKLDVLYFRNNQTPAVAERSLLVELDPGNAGVRNAPRPDTRPLTVIAPNQLPAAPRPDTRPVTVVAPSQLPAAPRQVPSAKKTLSDEREIDSLERGATLMRNGDIAAARLLYEDLAVNGSARGARALAETYDPAYLKGLFIAGLRPNLEKAKIWYERAAELGDTVSITRLSATNRR